jgi:hypothetical protein
MVGACAQDIAAVHVQRMASDCEKANSDARMAPLREMIIRHRAQGGKAPRGPVLELELSFVPDAALGILRCTK